MTILQVTVEAPSTVAEEVAVVFAVGAAAGFAAGAVVGVVAGDAVALLCSNRPEFIAVRFACHRMGIRLTPVNWHLAPEEAAYIIDNCDTLLALVSLSNSAQNHQTYFEFSERT